MIVEDDGLATAILRFDDWDRTWLFEGVVTSLLDEIDRQRFDRIWQEANAPTHWSESDLKLCADRATTSLAEKFSPLRAEVIERVVRAGTYQWK
jgi:hypothetical protein